MDRRPYDQQEDEAKIVLSNAGESRQLTEKNAKQEISYQVAHAIKRGRCEVTVKCVVKAKWRAAFVKQGYVITATKKGWRIQW